MPLSTEQKEWFDTQIKLCDPTGSLVTVDDAASTITYTSEMQSDESHTLRQTPEEYVHALLFCMLCTKYGYKPAFIYHEKHYERGSSGAKDDEMDFVIYDEDGLPFALIELKPHDLYARKSRKEKTIKRQLFAVAPLEKNPRLLVYATIRPTGKDAELTAVCIDYTKYKSYESWTDTGMPGFTELPGEYMDVDYEPYICRGKKDLKTDCCQADFKAVATEFHNSFFGEHPDNSLYVNLVKCLLAKIYDERTIKDGEKYQFQVEHRLGKPESADIVFGKVNQLYKEAYKRYIDTTAAAPDQIESKEFSKERVKEVVLALEGMSLTRGAALNGDIIGAFFEEILRAGFKQDKGMYFTHSNIARFMIEAIDLDGLTCQVWNKATHPDNRLPCIIDPACGSGTFLLHAMPVVTHAIKSREKEMVLNDEARQFYNARMSNEMPNYWAESFLYGFDPKFIMAITAKVNMVLHGDGSTHIFKYDAFSPFAKYSDPKLRINSEATRSIEKERYGKETCESFDVILSNPPFGVTLTSETAALLSKTFSLPGTASSEALFLERCFQLLKPGGRLGLVLPESIFNAAENMDVRLFLYRMFHIKAIVSLPRNIFIDTPTLTSLLFAQKKTASQIKEWDDAWEKNYDLAAKKMSDAKSRLSKKSVLSYTTAQDVENAVLAELEQIVSKSEWIIKKGKEPEIIPFQLPNRIASVSEAILYYKDLLKSASMDKLAVKYAFEKTAAACDSTFDTFVVTEVGYKLSKRKEKSRPNQLCTFIGEKSKKVINNLHLSSEESKIAVNTSKPQNVLDLMRKEVRWD